MSSSPARISPQARSSGGYGSWLGRDLESLDISSLHFAVAPDPVKVYIDKTGLYFGCRRQSCYWSERWASHRQRTHIEDTAVASGRHAVTLRLVQILPLRHPFHLSTGELARRAVMHSGPHAIHFHVAPFSDRTHVWPIYIGFRLEWSNRAAIYIARQSM